MWSSISLDACAKEIVNLTVNCLICFPFFFFFSFLFFFFFSLLPGKNNPAWFIPNPNRSTDCFPTFASRSNAAIFSFDFKSWIKRSLRYLRDGRFIFEEAFTAIRMGSEIKSFAFYILNPLEVSSETDRKSQVFTFLLVLATVSTPDIFTVYIQVWSDSIPD